MNKKERIQQAFGRGRITEQRVRPGMDYEYEGPDDWAGIVTFLLDEVDLRNQGYKDVIVGLDGNVSDEQLDKFQEYLDRRGPVFSERIFVNADDQVILIKGTISD